MGGSDGRQWPQTLPYYCTRLRKCRATASTGTDT